MHHKSDVCILGGGLVGGVTALALAHTGLSVTVADIETPENLLDQKLDGRTTAVNLASAQFFSAIGLWHSIQNYAAPINFIKVYEGGQPWSINFDHRDLGADPMGYIVENRYIRQAIFAAALNHPLINWQAPAKTLTKKINQTQATVYLDNGCEIETSLIICAEGRHSPSREEAGINKKQFSYDQKGLVFSVYHDRPHHNIAWEVFHPSGPLAFLPMLESPEGAYRSGVVWTLPVAEADKWTQASKEAIAEQLYRLFPHLGAMEIFTDVWSYPLMAQIVDRFIDNRFVIIGDAAHICHPVAGQGVNVGWRDAHELTTILTRNKQLGLDLGNMTALKQYQRGRRLDAYSIFAMTDGMVRLYSNNSKILSPIRSMGLGIVNKVPPLKRFFMKRAMGIN
ncbi:FAD-dependent monooxygenase [Candidatus Odyssella thessalonicensis]|uniref:FAD-dependent monooxygenase n=1 Tax=Candidatus Odyssella thessalonicensis TaxID=84647 RepID=UPI000225B1EE|nr:FAD-dependent monooxygenase [Candidatus Odyssella thessalonicensis]